MKRILTAFVLLLCSFSLIDAKTERLYAYKNAIPDGYDFFVITPSDVPEGEQLPVVLFLHGRSLTGHDLNMVLRYGCLDAIKRGVNINAIVIAPQTTVESWDTSKLNDVLEYVLPLYNGDRNRVYVVGMSMGGWGTLKMVQAYPDKVAAALAMCGGYTQPSFDGLLQVPLWIIHGTHDDVTPCSYSMDLVTEMCDSGKADRLLFEFPPCDHSMLARVFSLDDLYSWLFCHSLTDENRIANRDYRITISDITNAYSKVHAEPVTFEIIEVK